MNRVWVAWVLMGRTCEMTGLMGVMMGFGVAGACVRCI